MVRHLVGSIERLLAAGSVGASNVSRVRETPWRGTTDAMKTIVALIDLTEVTPKILGLAQTLAAALRSHVILLHVVPPAPLVATLGGEMPAIPEPPAPDEMEARKARFQEMLDSLTQNGINATALQFEGPVVGTVLEETQKLNADLVIMGSHHHHAIDFFVAVWPRYLSKRLPFPCSWCLTTCRRKRKYPCRASIVRRKRSGVTR